MQPDLARTLEEIAAEGAESFYRGRLARADSQRVSTPPGRWSRRADLAAFEAEEQQPIAIDYRGFTVLEAPPNSTGFVLLEELKIVEHFDLAAMGLLSADAVHVMVEAKKLAFADRERWAADPRTIMAPLEELLSADYTARLAAGIDMRRAARSGRRPLPTAIRPISAPPMATATPSPACRASIAALVPGVIAGDTGILLNNRMAYWHLEPGHPNRLRPGRRVRHTMNPPIVLKDGALWCVFGTPGADNQVQINMQVLTAMIDFRLRPAAGGRNAALDVEYVRSVRELAA